MTAAQLAAAVWLELTLAAQTSSAEAKDYRIAEAMRIVNRELEKPLVKPRRERETTERSE